MRIALGLDVSPASSFATVVSVREAAPGAPRTRTDAAEVRPLRRAARLAPKSTRVASIVDATHAAIAAADDQFGHPTSVALAYPIRWEDDTVVRLRRALRLAQLRDVMVVSTAVAAAAGTDVRHPLVDGSSVVVVEFGPGSAQVQSLRKVDGAWHPVGDALTIADPRVGGAETWSSRLFATLRGPRMPGAIERVILTGSGAPVPNVLSLLASRLSIPVVKDDGGSGSFGAAVVAAVAAGIPVAIATGSRGSEIDGHDRLARRWWAWPFGDGSLTMNQLWPITLAAALFVALVGASGGVLNSTTVGSHPSPTPRTSSEAPVVPLPPAAEVTDAASAAPQVTSPSASAKPAIPRKKSGGQTAVGPAPVVPPGGVGPLPTTAPDPTSSPTTTSSPSPTPTDTDSPSPSPTSTDPPAGP